MSHQTILFGYILGPGCTYPAARAHNLTTLAALPTVDEWPPLVRGMFMHQDHEYEHRGELIVVGSTLAGLDNDGIRWLRKFEALLSRLCWEAAHLRVTQEFGDVEFGPSAFDWRATDEAVLRWQKEPVMPVDEWDHEASMVPIGRSWHILPTRRRRDTPLA